MTSRRSVFRAEFRATGRAMEDLSSMDYSAKEKNDVKGGGIK